MVGWLVGVFCLFVCGCLVIWLFGLFGRVIWWVDGLFVSLILLVGRSVCLGDLMAGFVG